MSPDERSRSRPRPARPDERRSPPGRPQAAGAPDRKRRSLTHVGGRVETSGDRALAAALAEALDVPPAPPLPDGALRREREPGRSAAPVDDPDRAHVHGFHTYPARMHPSTAAGLVRACSGPREVVLDPFCGSGTVLVEARLAGRCAVGLDLNPLAVRIARLKTDPRDARSREAIVSAAREVAAIADARRERRAGATRRYPPEDVASFDPHVLLELDSLRAGVAERCAEDAYVRDGLELVLSSILVKVSRRTSDTSSSEAPRRIAAGYPARLFVRRAIELAGRLGELASRLPPGAPPARVAVDDARRMRTLPAATVDAVVTSPPYAGTYDYVAHHALRLRWLALDARAFVEGEIGSRRRYARLDASSARGVWAGEIGACLRALSRVCRRGARVAMLLGDSAVAGEALRADAALSSVAPQAGFIVRARASQRRPHFHDEPRAEHAFVLEKR